MAVIEVHDLQRRFGTVQAVRGVNFEVREGEIFAFLGPNGAGKSTTISMLATLLHPTAGTAKVAGFDVVREPARVRHSIGIVFQDPTLDDRLTAEENLQFHALLYNVDSRIVKERVPRLLEMVELLDRRKSLVRTFSGGMKRRLEIARGLLHHPKVLFLDEPTIGLDPQTRARIWEYVRGLRDQEGITVFMTTHYMDEAEVCDRIAVIDHGQIVALGTPSELKALVGGDVITLSANDQEKARQFIAARYGEPIVTPGGLQFEVTGGETIIPELVASCPTPVRAISLRKPTLDDVFLKLTGREIRDEPPQNHRPRMARIHGGR